MFNYKRDDQLRDTVWDQNAPLEARVNALHTLLEEMPFSRASWFGEERHIALFVKILHNHDYQWDVVREMRLEVARWLIKQATNPTHKLFDPGLRLLGYIFEEFPELRDEAEAVMHCTMARLRWEANAH